MPVDDEVNFIRDVEPEDDISDMSIDELMKIKPDKGRKISDKNREKCLCVLISIFGKVIVQLADDDTGPTILEFDHEHLEDDNGWHKVTQEEKDRGYIQLSSVDVARTSYPVGTGIRHHLKLDDAVIQFFPVLVSDIPDEKKLDAMIEYDELHGINHARWFRRLREAGVI